MAENSWDVARRSTAWETPAVGPVTEHATIGPSIVIKGEVSGQEALFVEGVVEGSIQVPGHRVTIGRRSQVKADVKAHDVVVMGSVKGNIYCSDLLDIRAESTIQGEIVTRRIRIDDGAVLKGSVEIEMAGRNPREKEPEAPKPALAVAESTTPAPAVAQGAQSEAAKPEPVKSEPVKSEPMKSEPEKSLTATVAAPSSAKRVPGSSVLWRPGR
jgi:cytoskeletal protein CcmA (bactofilin family)